MDDVEQKAAKRLVKRVASTPEDFRVEKIAKDLRQCAPEDLQWLRSQLRKRLKETPPSFVRPYQASAILEHLGDPECVRFHIRQLQLPVTSLELGRTLGVFENRRRIEQLGGPGIGEEIRRSLLVDFEKRLTSHGHSWGGIPNLLISVCEVWGVQNLAGLLAGLWNDHRTVEQLGRLCRPEVVRLLTTVHVAAAVTAFESSSKSSSDCYHFLSVCGAISHSEKAAVRRAAAVAAEQALAVDHVWQDDEHIVLPYRREDWSSELSGFLERLLASKPSQRHAARAIQLLAEFKPEAVLEFGADSIPDRMQRIELCERIAQRLNRSANKKALRFIQNAARSEPPEQRLRFAFMCRMVGGLASDSVVADLAKSLSQPDRNLLDLAPDGNAAAPFDRLLGESGLLKKMPRKSLPDWTNRLPGIARSWTLQRMESLGLAVALWPEVEQKVGRHDQAMLKMARLLKAQLGKSTASQSLRCHRNSRLLLSVTFDCERGHCTLDIETSEKCLNVGPLYNAINWLLHREKLPERVVPIEDSFLVAGPPDRILALADHFGWTLQVPVEQCLEGKLAAIEPNDWKVLT